MKKPSKRLDAFLKTPLRRLRYLKAGAALVLGIALLGMTLLPQMVGEAHSMAYIFVAICFAAATTYFVRARRTPPEETTTLATIAVAAHLRDHATMEKMGRFLRAFIVICAILSTCTAHELRQLETGAEERVQVWTPVALIYEHLGYWPAVLAPLAMGLLLSALAIHKKRHRLRRTPDQDPHTEA